MDHIETGKLGERLAEKHLISKGFSVIGRNYRKFFGEIDIIAKKEDTIHFIEVKSVNMGYGIGGFRPEDNVHEKKIQRLYKTIGIYLIENNYKDDQLWQIDVVSVYIDSSNKKADIKLLMNAV